VADAAEELVHVLADVLVAEPGIAPRLLAVHVAGDDGRCSGCLGRLRPAWPCQTRWLTTRAVEEVERRSA
jgi:hypothetical protein